MFGNIFGVLAGLFSVLYVSGNRQLIHDHIRAVLKNFAIYDSGNYVDIDTYISISQYSIDAFVYMAVVVLSIILSGVINSVYSVFSSKKFAPLLIPIREISTKHYGTGCTNASDLKIYLCEIRSIFCKYFYSNEIGIAVFTVEKDSRKNASGAAMLVQKMLIDFDGRVGEADFSPAKFSYGKGIIGHSWHRQEVTFGKRTIFYIFYNPIYVKLKNQNDSANSFCCIPIIDSHNDSRVFCAVSIETAERNHFNWSARRDKTYRDISNEISKVIAKYIKNIYGDLPDDLRSALPGA